MQTETSIEDLERKLISGLANEEELEKAREKLLSLQAA